MKNILMQKNDEIRDLYLIREKVEIVMSQRSSTIDNGT